MSSPQLRTLPEFNPADPNTTAKEWEAYKRSFLVHLDALGLDEKPGKRKVGVLLANMGKEAIKIYDSFTWAPRVEGNADNNIPDVPAEDKHDLDTVFKKFDTHFGVHNYRNIKRQEFLNTKRGNKSIMDYITELKKKAEYCEYGDQREGLICDMIINGVNDRKCTEKLMEIPAAQLTLDKVIQTCRQVELTKAHIDTLDAENPHVNYVKPKQKVGYQGTHPYCDKCTKHHALRTCPAFNKQCNICGMRGHFKASPICKGTQHAPRSSRFPRRGTSGRGSFSRGYSHSRGRGRSGYRQNVHFTESVDTVDVAQPNTHDDMHVGEMFDQCTIHDVYAADSNVLNDTSRSSSDSDWSVTFDVKGINLTLEIDTGARCNVIAKSIAEKFTAIAPIRKANNYINGISGHLVEPVGQIILPCRHNGKLMNLMFQILDTERPICLLGRPDSVRYNLVMRVNSVTSCIEDLIGSFSDVVGEEIGCLPGEYEIKVDSSVQPVVHAPRPVPVAMRDQVKRELDNLVRCGIIASVTEPTEWVSSMVCVRKKNGRVRICLDPTDLNKAVLREHFPMNSIEDIVTRVHGSKVFSTLDANMGYFQIRLTQKSSMLTTFNTPFGRYRYLRMPMGLKCAAEVFQREMINHFGGIEGVEVVIDDILIHGANMEQHNARLRTVLQKARSINLKLNKAKCVIGKPEVNYVGHLLTGDGLKPTPERVRAITEMRVPENHAELETILGMLAYVAKFIPKLSELNAPLRALKTQEQYVWTPEVDQAFRDVKNALTSTDVLRYFDASKPLTLSVDASQQGLGAAVIQNHGVVAYASRALTPAEQRYAQIEKEMLAVVFGCERFHKLIYGKSDVTIESDHKPLESIMKKPIHSAPMRIQKMMLKLQPYEFTLIHVKGKDLGLADCLSRLPLPETCQSMDDEVMVFPVETLTSSSHDVIVEATKRDDQLQLLKRVISDGWPDKRSAVPLEVLPFWDVRDELSTYNGVIYRGERVVIPSELRATTLKTIHSSHMGMTKCKQRARELVYWPGMNKQIEDTVSRCSACLKYQNKPQKEPMIIHPLPSLPWSKVGADLFEYDGQHYLILVDYYSNFIEVAPLARNLTSRHVIQHVKDNIARYGIMDTLSNGLAEKSVQTVKNLIKKCSDSGDDIYLALLDLRNTPRDDEMGSPMQRLMGRRAKTRLPISENLRKPSSINPSVVSNRLMDYRQKQKFYYDQNAKERAQCREGDSVRIHTPDGWKPAEYIKQSSEPRSHIVKAGSSGRLYRRNNSMLLKTQEDPHIIQEHKEAGNKVVSPEAQSVQPKFAPPQPQSVVTKPAQSANEHIPKDPSQKQLTTRSGRVIRKPSYLSDYST
ncbi:hypothetical protein FSP39_016659 [Pinctada imbricata]|uniref:Reverse transcriptase domain-containing protein n=1 Tax=Pinctada imbricata TaxID=66713 RepID=A0AA88Y4A2_PINIB|nr:hypothetical protein FSP39_016659 [Pinctada imbricata]